MYGPRSNRPFSRDDFRSSTPSLSSFRTRGLAFGRLLLAALVLLLGLATGASIAQDGTDDVAAPATTPESETPTDSEDGDASTDDPAAEPVRQGRAPVVLMAIDSAIHPVASEFVAESLALADAEGATALVVELNTPGGLLTSTREITEAMLQAETPVVIYVSPNGARAASAGFFLLMASDVAAMAPGTNTGAAHPVSGQGEDIEGDMRKKVEEDTTAMIRSLASQNGRNVELAQAAVLESRSFTAEEALENGLIEVVAPNLEQLLLDLDGRLVDKPGQEPRILRTAGAPRIEREMSPIQRFLASIAEPQIAGLLMLIGFLGIYMEWSNPGILVPGMVGAICLILGFYALSVLPINFAGVALIVLALVLFVMETQVPTFGILTAGGSISLILGAILLFKDRELDPHFDVQLDWLVAFAVVAAAIAALLSWKALSVRNSRVTTGREGLVGERGTARGDLAPKGKVFVHGEIWTAIAEQPVPEGATVEVVAVDGLTLQVRGVGATLVASTAAAASEITTPEVSTENETEIVSETVEESPKDS